MSFTVEKIQYYRQIMEYLDWRISDDEHYQYFSSRKVAIKWKSLIDTSWKQAILYLCEKKV